MLDRSCFFLLVSKLRQFKMMKFVDIPIVVDIRFLFLQRFVQLCFLFAYLKKKQISMNGSTAIIFSLIFNNL